MRVPADYRHDRPSDAPISMTGSMTLPPTGWASLSSKIPQSWIGASGYLVVGIVLGLLLIYALSIGRGDPAAGSATANVVTDNVVRLHAREIGSSCWAGFDKLGPARITVVLEVGADGKVHHAAASGETSAMRGCVEAHVKSWEFLPQSQPQTMALPFEIDRR